MTQFFYNSVIHKTISEMFFMSDLLLVGTSPTSEEGKEFFLHSTDWWWDILEVFNILLKDIYPVDKYFVRESPLALPTPSMNAEESLIFSVLVENILKDGSASACLRKIYKEHPWLVDYYGDDEELINDNIIQRSDQLEKFAGFLKSCGGCTVKWYSPD